MNLIFFGPPGSGKGTYSKRVSRQLNIPHISTGDIFRDNMKRKTELGIQIEEKMKAGQLIEDGITNAIVKDRLAQPDCSNGYALDGYPRTIPQAQDLENYQKIDTVINIDVPEEVIIRRITTRRMCKCGESYNILTLKPKVENICDKCGQELYQRSDDTEEAVKARLVEYEQLTKPLLNYYKEKGIVKTVTWKQELVPEGDIDIPVEVLLEKIMNLIKE